MPELKRNFSAAKMNKDLDERLIPNGQYKDALNIQIATSDGSNVGSAQTLLGNTRKFNMPDFKSGIDGVYSSILSDAKSTCVGSIALPDKDKIYYLVAAGLNNTTKAKLDIQKDYIIEYDTIKETLLYVFVDIYQVNEETSASSTSSEAFLYIPNLSSATINKTGVRIGMQVSGTLGSTTYTKEDGITVKDIIYNSGNTSYKIFLQKDGSDFTPATGVGSGDAITFSSPRVLNFDYDRKITAINVVDDLLFWTDNVTEPKKINIKRSISGTGGEEYLIGGGVNGFASGSPTDAVFEGETDYFHTRLVIDKNNDGRLKVVTDAAVQKAVYVEEKHVSVIKKAPTQPLELEMSRSINPRINQNGVTNLSDSVIGNTKWYDSNDDLLEAGSTRSITFGTTANPVFSDFREGDILIFTNDLKNSASSSFKDHEVRAVVIWSPVVNPNFLTQTIEIRILSISPSLPNENQQWFVRIEDTDVFFEHKLVRFSYRYKYADGEYSPFAPFSQVAFLPDKYEYLPKKGFNLGMRNQLRGLKLKQYHPEPGALSEDVVEIDLLYKETNNPTVYTVKTLKPSDGHPQWPDLTHTQTADHAVRGEYEVKTDLIHAVVPSNQLLRPWDNVPRKALGQEITANRLVYGNYVQNYTISEDPKINLDFVSDRLQDITSTLPDGTTKTGSDYALPSVKSIRTYQVGVVFSDGYGRETPVLTNKNASINIPKSASSTRNRIMATLKQNTVIPSWAKYFSWYIKEPTVEYYTLAMDRWYHAADGNVWISFPSSDRNKVDIETFLILKKAHTSNTAVEDKARYKILALENEAPDFIKTESKGLGTLLNTSDATGPNKIGTGSGDGYPFVSSTFIKVDINTFDSIFGDDLIIKTPDSLWLKFYGAGTQSEEYEVTKLTLGATHYELKIAGRFEDDVSFTTVSTNQTYSGRINDLQLELIERKVENRPEFDGRFFAKIYKDSILETHILSKQQDNNELFIGPSWQLKYLNNNYDSQPLYYTSRQQGNNFGTSRSALDHPTELSHHWTGSPAAAYQWGGTSGQSHGLHKDNIDNSTLLGNGDDSVNGLNGGTGDTETFWEELAAETCFFIDACSAYSLTSKSGQGKDRPGGLYSDGTPLTNLGGPYNNFGSPGNVAGALSPSNFPINISSQEDMANTLEKKGQVSRGIWFHGSDCYMDISWTGMGTDYTGGSLDSMSIPHKLQEVSGGDHEDAAAFIQELVQPGTKFRFQRDPDVIIYTVEQNDKYFPGTGHPHANPPFYQNNTTITTGVWGIRNFYTDVATRQFLGHNLRQRWTIKVANDNGNGIGIDGSQYNPCTGTGVNAQAGNQTRALKHDADDYDTIQIMRPFTNASDPTKDTFTDNPAIWETEPKESADVDIYYQASGLIPLELNEKTNEEYIPTGTTFKSTDNTGTKTEHIVTSFNDKTITFHQFADTSTGLPVNTDILAGSTIEFTKRNHYSFEAVTSELADDGDTVIKLHGGLATTTQDYKLFRQPQILDWNNCWCFGNGVESDRIRDDFNAPQMDNGVKASTVLAEPIKEERREHGLIWSGIYNSQSGVNDTNQFIQAEKITKDLNPVYGSIQKLYAKPSLLITFCEDRVLKILSNKDALYNADGNPQLIATNRVLGDAQTYKGNYGISTNPESFVATPYQLYFADAMRGEVLALEPNGIRSISNLGMKDYFADNLKKYVDTLQGTYDSKKHEYNITIAKKYHYTQISPTFTSTVSFSEKSNGWSSFKSFHPENGLSLNNNYYTFKNGELYKHHDDTVITLHGAQGGSTTQINMSSVDNLTVGMVVSGKGVVNGTTISSISGLTITINNATTARFTAQLLEFTIPRNNFYGTQYESDVTLVFNDNPTAVKSFNVVNYEGTQAKVTAPSTTSTTDAVGNTITSTAADHGDYFNLADKQGWYVDSITTNKQTGNVVEFKDKECKWFGSVAGDSTVSSGSSMNVDSSEFSVQGLGTASFSFAGGGSGTPPAAGHVELNFGNNTSSSYVGIDGSGSAWDSSSVITNEQSHWTVATVPTLHPVVGVTVSSGTVDLTITPIINGIHSGYPLTAGDFSIGGATESSSGSGVWNGGNVDSPITSVTFTDNGQPGDMNNTVKARVTYGSFTAPTSDTTYYIDIDEDTAPVQQPRSCAVRTNWIYSANQTVTVTNIANITETSVSAGSATTVGIYTFDGTVTGGASTKIAEMNFEASTGYHYEDLPTITMLNLVSGGTDYSNQYTTVIEPTYTNNKMISFKAQVFYTPGAPDRGNKTNLFPDPTSMLELNHTANIEFELRETVAVLTNTITHIDYQSETDSSSKPALIRVHGVASTTYNIQVSKQASTTSDTVAASGGYYNFETNAFQDDAFVSATQTIPVEGVNTHIIMLPVVTENTRYDIILGSISGSTIPTNLDGHGEASITQNGFYTITLKPKTYTSAHWSDFDPTTLSIIRPVPTTAGTGGVRGKTIIAKAGNANTLGTDVVLEKEHREIQTGMYVTGIGSDGTRSSHGTTVSKIKGRTITLSQALKVPAGTRLRFDKNISTIYPFDFTIPPNTSRVNLLSINGGEVGQQPSTGASNGTLTTFTGHIAGFKDVSTLTNGATSSSTTLVLDTTRGITVGMTVSGTGISGTPTVATVASLTNITLSDAQTISNDVEMTFSGNPGVNVIDIQATRVDGDIKVQGLIDVREIDRSADAYLNIDDFINVT